MLNDIDPSCNMASPRSSDPLPLSPRPHGDGTDVPQVRTRSRARASAAASSGPSSTQNSEILIKSKNVRQAGYHNEKTDPLEPSDTGPEGGDGRGAYGRNTTRPDRARPASVKVVTDLRCKKQAGWLLEPPNH